MLHRIICCNKNQKKDGENYDIYTDGLKIYTTIDSRMQAYAEEAAVNHVGHVLQKEFEYGRNHPNFPFTNNLTKEQISQILNRSMRQSERYVKMKAAGASEAEMKQAFATPVEMTVFTWNGAIDTVMTPMDSIRHYKKFLRSGLVSIDPMTGFVKAYVGGLNYTYFQYDMAFKGRRQVGSTMKPFVYAMAMEDGMLPSDTIVNMQREYQVGDKVWAPRNAGNARYGEPVTLKWGLSQSNNWITAELMYQSDPEGVRLAKYLREFGVANNEIHPSLALCLGTCDITVAEMASAYTAFVNKGIRSAPILVSRIEDANGTVIAEFAPRMNEVISEQSSYRMLDMLQGVVDAGTGIRLRYKYNFTAPIAGKTGTTNSNSDGWFVGCVPRLITACWVGGEDRDIHFLSTSLGQGASTALPVWAEYMKKVYEDKTLGYTQEEGFDIDREALQIPVDTLNDIVFKNGPQLPSQPVEPEEDVDSYFE